MKKVPAAIKPHLAGTTDLPAFGASDIAAARAAGWDDEAIYFAITTCALFNFYNRWITATGVPSVASCAVMMRPDETPIFLTAK